MKYSISCSSLNLTSIFIYNLTYSNFFVFLLTKRLVIYKMPKTDGHITRKNILKVAEKLFSENGFDGTSVDKIAKTAKVNKATIYYHFKDKKEIIGSLFKEIMEDLEVQLQSRNDGSKNKADKMRQEIEFLESKKKIMSVILMESLKNKNYDNTLFQCGKAVMETEKRFVEKLGSIKKDRERQQFLVHEFFTGFMPIVTFMIFKDQWCKFFECDKETIMDDFMKAFEISHIKSHIK